MTTLEDDDREIIPMRIIEEIPTGDSVVTYYDLIRIDKNYFWRYDGVNHGPFKSIEDTVESAVQSLTDTDGL